MGILLSCVGGSGAASSKQPCTTIEYLCHRFSLSQLRKSTGDFDKSRKIGEGPYGDVYRGCISINGESKEIAVKRLRLRAGLRVYKNEILFMCQLRHPNVASLVGFCDDKNEMMGVYEHITNGSLHNQLRGRDRKSPVLSWKKRLEISIGVARGLHYLHTGTRRIIIHRDIKPSIILLDENWVPKLSGFGLSVEGPKFSSKDTKPITVEVVEGTLGHVAPECLHASMVTYKCDVYSFGVLLLELMCGNKLSQAIELMLEGVDHENLYALSTACSVAQMVQNLATKGNAEKMIDPSLEGEIAPGCWKFYMDIIETCLSEDPNERPAMGEVEVQLERLLELQDDADANHGFHTSFSL